MPRGGARRGAGRPLGSKSKKTRLLSDNITVTSDDVAAADALLDLMQKIAHDPNANVQQRLDAAKAAAPYLLARIGARPPDATTNSIAPIKCLQPVAIPSGCFPTKEQLENPELLMEHAVPMSLVDVAEPVIDDEAKAEVRGPRRARVYTPTLDVSDPAAPLTVIEDDEPGSA